jgi:glycosyltransferase involved in cell wall biosynthesis
MSEGVRDVLVYISRVDLNEPTGQSSFERGFINALLRVRTADRSKDVRILTVSSPLAADEPHDGRIIAVPLARRRFGDYVSHQARLLVAMIKLLRELRGKRVAVFVRFSPTMVVPLLVATILQIPLVYRTGPVIPSIRAYRSENRRWVLGPIAALAGLYARKAKRIVVATHAIREWVINAYPTARSKTIVVPNGADLGTLQLAKRDRARWKVPETAIVVGYVGSFIREQGLDTVIRAIAKLGGNGLHPYLLAVGQGPLAGEWQSLAEELGLKDQVIWVGAIPHSDVPSAIAACDVMVMPLTNETIRVRGTSATKLFEYLACDRFVLGSRCTDLQFIEQHQVGRMVEAEDVSAWATAIREETETVRDIQQKGRALIRNEYSYDAVARQIWTSCFEAGPRFRHQDTVTSAT